MELPQNSFRTLLFYLLAKRLLQGHLRFRSIGRIKIAHECCPIVLGDELCCCGGPFIPEISAFYDYNRDSRC